MFKTYMYYGRIRPYFFFLFSFSVVFAPVRRSGWQ